MPFEIATATHYLDLLARVETFATAQGWTVRRSTYNELTDTDGELILSAPGLSATEDIVCMFRSVRNVPSDIYNFELAGARGWSNVAWGSLQEQSTSVYLPLWNAAIPYWLVCNGQRLAMVAQVSTVYVHLYMGFIDSYGTDAEYAYPLLIGGSSNTNIRWSTQTSSLAAYWSANAAPTRGYIYTPGGIWIPMYMSTGSTANIVRCWPWQDDGTPTIQLLTHTNGVYPLFPSVLSIEGSQKGVLGELDGVSFLPGAGVGTGDIIEVGATDHLVAQNTYRNNVYDFCALELS